MLLLLGAGGAVGCATPGLSAVRAHADLGRAHLEDAALKGARYDRATVYPALFFDPPGKGALLVQEGPPGGEPPGEAMREAAGTPPNTFAPSVSNSLWRSRKAHDCGVQPRAPGIWSQPAGIAAPGFPERG